MIVMPSKYMPLQPRCLNSREPRPSLMLDGRFPFCGPHYKPKAFWNSRAAICFGSVSCQQSRRSSKPLRESVKTRLDRFILRLHTRHVQPCKEGCGLSEPSFALKQMRKKPSLNRFFYTLWASFSYSFIFPGMELYCPSVCGTAPKTSSFKAQDNI